MSLSINPKDIGLKFARTLKTKKRRTLNPLDSKTEKPLQDACETWLEKKGIAYLHIPAFILSAGFAYRPGISGTAAAGAMRNAAKDIRGFPDLCIFHPDQKHYRVDELKSRTGSLTDAQEKWKTALAGKVFRNFDEWRIDVEKWLENPNGGEQ